MNLQFDSETHTYTVNGRVLPSVTQILKDMGFIDSRFFTEIARERGSYVHQMVEWHSDGTLDESEVDDRLMPYLDAWIRFRADTGFASTEVEKPCHSDTYGFAGTPDQVGILHAENAILDIKTGQNLPVHGLQLAGYEVLKCGRYKRFGLQLKPDGKYSLMPYRDRQDRAVFLAAVSCWHWKNNH